MQLIHGEDGRYCVVIGRRGRHEKMVEKGFAHEFKAGKKKMESMGRSAKFKLGKLGG